MKKLLLLLPLLLLLTAVPLTCQAASQAAASSYLPVAVTPVTEDSASSIQSIQLWDSGSGVYLFLPSGWDASALRVWSLDGSGLALDGTSVENGGTVSCLTPGASVSFTHGGVSFTATVRQSSNVAAAFMTTESGSLTYIETKKSNREPGTILITDKDGSVVCSQALT